MSGVETGGGSEGAGAVERSQDGERTGEAQSTTEQRGYRIVPIDTEEYITRDIYRYVGGFVPATKEIGGAARRNWTIGVRTDRGKISEDLASQSVLPRIVQGEIATAAKHEAKLPLLPRMAGKAKRAIRGTVEHKATLDPTNLMAWLRIRAWHKREQTEGRDPNLAGNSKRARKARGRSRQELAKITGWYDRLSGAVIAAGGDPPPLFSNADGSELSLPPEGPLPTPADSEPSEVTAPEPPRHQPEEPPQTAATAEPTPPPEPETPEHERAIIEDCRAISDQIIMNNFPVELIEAMHRAGRTPEQIDQAWKNAARRYFQEITIHRHGRRREDNPITGEKKGDPYGDIDGSSAVALLKMAGVKVSLNFVDSGEYEKGRVNIDTGYEPGQAILDIDEEGQKKEVEYIAIGAEGKGIEYRIFNDIPDRLAVFWDHHGKDAPRNKSATMLAYERFTRLGLLDPKLETNMAVWLVNEIDNGLQPAEVYENSHKTIWGLAPHMRFEDIVSFFKEGGEEGGSPDEELTPEQLERYDLVNKEKGTNVPEEVKKYIRINLTERKSMEEEGRIVPSKYGALGIGKVRWEARGENIAATLNWDPRNEGDRLFFSAVDDFDQSTIDFFERYGVPIVKSNVATKVPLIIPGPIPFSLGELLDELGVSKEDIESSEELKKRVEKDRQRVEKLRAG